VGKKKTPPSAAIAEARAVDDAKVPSRSANWINAV
jgi:hypothetical protein